jgi:hypothetical protein
VEKVKPVTELALFGEMPRSPATMLGPVLVTAKAPRTPKLAAWPKLGAVAATVGSGSYRSAANPAPIKRLRYVPVPFIGDLLPLLG